jgi:hypothetical protein
MNQHQQLILRLELVWWVATAVLVFAVLYPIHQTLKIWPFLTWNIIYIVALVTLTRYIFQLEHTFLAKRQILKAMLIIVLLPITFSFISGLNGFLSWIEENTWEPITGDLPFKKQQSIQSYAWNQMIFFAAGSIIAAIVFAVRLFISIWRTHNRGTV